MANRCWNCGYCWADVDMETGKPLTGEYCHYNDPWPAPCEYDDEPEEPSWYELAGVDPDEYE